MVFNLDLKLFVKVPTYQVITNPRSIDSKNL